MTGIGGGPSGRTRLRSRSVVPTFLPRRDSLESSRVLEEFPHVNHGIPTVEVHDTSVSLRLSREMDLGLSSPP